MTRDIISLGSDYMIMSEYGDDSSVWQNREGLNIIVRADTNYESEIVS